MFRRTTLISLTALLCGLGSSTAQADMTCTQAPDCASLGYNQTEAECASKPSLKCPFDTSKYYCKQTPVVDGCTVGSFIYADKSCSNVYDKTRTLVGVVFDPVNNLAVMSGFLLPANFVSFKSDTGIPTCSKEGALTACGTDGKINTRYIFNSGLGDTTNIDYSLIFGVSVIRETSQYGKIVAICTISSCSDLDSSLWYGKNHWYYPSLLELDKIYKNLDTINNSFRKVIDSNALIPTNEYFSSTYNEYDKVFTYNFSTGEITVKSIGTYIGIKPYLPIINYGDDTSVLTCSETGTVNYTTAPFYNGYDKGGCFQTKCQADLSISTSDSYFMNSIQQQCRQYGYCLGDITNGVQYYSCCNQISKGCQH